tara:strand:+ start:101 stop:394 length:294 start_codon:yes stop_codon:yes gene_type:complete
MMMDPEKAKARARKQLARQARKAAAAPAQKSPAQKLFDEVAAEIDERVTFLQRMTELGQAKKHEATIRGEIADRTATLEKLHAIIVAEQAAVHAGNE